jgi:D-alanine--poly(phosphoribitol) ligase subunit 2
MKAHALDTHAARTEVRAKILELASRLHAKNPALRDDEVIPESGLLDSAAIMELIVWLETHFDFEIEQSDLTTENFGTIDAIVDYLSAHAGPVA